MTNTTATDNTITIQLRVTMCYWHKSPISWIAGVAQITHVIMVGNAHRCAALARYSCLATWSERLCCHLSVIGISNTSYWVSWFLPFICMSLMDYAFLGATAMPVVSTNIAQPIGPYIIREKSQLLFNLPYFLFCIYQQYTFRCISYWMGFDANYCIIHILLFILNCVFCSPLVYIL